MLQAVGWALAGLTAWWLASFVVAAVLLRRWIRSDPDRPDRRSP